jgi:hypothetical protein
MIPKSFWRKLAWLTRDAMGDVNDAYTDRMLLINRKL